MAVAHIEFEKGSAYGQLLTRSLTQLKEGLESIVDLIAIMDQMKNSGVIDDYMRGKFGFQTIPAAQAGYDELSSLASKLTTNNSVTDVNAALLQAFHKFA